MQQECIYTRFHFRKVFFVCRAFIATCRAACIITVTGTGRSSPKINVFRKHLPYIGSTHCLTVQGQYLGTAFIRPCKLCEYPQYKNIEHGKEYAESNGYSN